MKTKVVNFLFTFFAVMSCLLQLGQANCTLHTLGLCTQGCGSKFAAGWGGGGASQGGSAGYQGGGGTAGSGGDSCGPTQKFCSGSCVDLDDPAYGCAHQGCEPCLVPNAVPTCDQGACAVGECDQGNGDCLGGAEDGCETDLRTDLGHCGGCGSACPVVTGGDCAVGKCTGPCGELVMSGWSICYVYDAALHAANPTLNVGLAGAVVPDGGSLQALWNDPMIGASVNPDNTKDFILYQAGTLAADTMVQFRAGLHAGTFNGTTAGTFACGDTTCTGECYVYHDGEEVGSMVNSTPTGVITLVPHFIAPVLLDLNFTVGQ